MRRSLPALQLIVTIAALLAVVPLAAQPTPSPASAAASNFVKGMQALTDGKYSQAITLLQGVVAAEPNNEPAWFNLGVAKFSSLPPDLPGALEAFRKALTLYPDRAGTRLYIGRIYEAQGAYEEAIAQFIDEMRHTSGANLVLAQVALARTYYKAAAYEKARDMAMGALKIEPKMVEAMYVEGMARTKLRDYAGAIDVFKQAHQVLQDFMDLSNALHGTQARTEQQGEIKQTEERLAQDYHWAQDFAQRLGMWPALNKALGDAYLGEKDFMLARRAYLDAANLNQLGDKSDPDVYARVARAFLADARNEFVADNALFTAIKLVREGDHSIDQALALNAKFAPAWEVRGQIYTFEAATYDSDPKQQIVSHSYDEAVTAFNNALQADPSDADAMSGLARTYIQQAQLVSGTQKAKDLLTKARGLLQQALTLQPGSAQYYVLLAQISLAQEQYTDAKAMSEKALVLDTKNPEAYNLSGLSDYFTGDIPEALREFQQGIQLSPHEGRYHFNLGNAYFQIQSWYLARREYESAFQYTPSAYLAKNLYQRSYILYMTALTYHETRAYDAEISTLNRALAIDNSYFDAYMQLARAYAAEAEYRGAQQALLQATQRAATDQQSSQVATMSGQMYEAAGDLHAAVAAYATALNLDKTNVLAREALNRLSGQVG